MKICFATNNSNKLSEIKKIVGDSHQITSLKEINCTEEIPETHPTIAENSMEKAMYVYKNYDVSCFADDTGLCVEALHNEPGVFSARYAGDHCSSDDNMALLLKNLEGSENRKAHFLTVITLVLDGTSYTFEGKVDGEILKTPSGKEGFGYDPIFKPTGYDISFAEMNQNEKNKISHRGIATQKLCKFLNEIKSN